jgi:hypothetical protein
MELSPTVGNCRSLARSLMALTVTNSLATCTSLTDITLTSSHLISYQPRKGEPFTLRVDMNRTDSDGWVKYILAFETTESLAEWTTLFKPSVKFNPLLATTTSADNSNSDTEEEEEAAAEEDGNDSDSDGPL